MDDLRHSKPLVDVPEMAEPSIATNNNHRRPHAKRDDSEPKPDGTFPTDSCRTENMVSVTSYVTILEDLLLRLQINVAVAKGFQGLEFPHPDGENSKRYIDLWPIQMSAEIASEGDDKANVLTTNFDTCKSIFNVVNQE